MLTSISATNRLGNILSLPLETPENGIIVADVDGLGPVKASIVSTNFADLDGSIPQAARRESRNILMKLDLDPFYGSVEDARKLAYSYFMPKTYVTLRFLTDRGLDVFIKGMVESADPTMFSRDPQLTVSILCFDPDFQSWTETSVSGTTTTGPAFVPLNYTGEIETGFLLTVEPDTFLESLAIQVITPDGIQQEMIYDREIVSGSRLEIDTRAGQKGAHIIYSSFRSSMLYAITITSDWPVLYPGESQIRIAADDPAPYTIKYRNLYGGL